MDWKMICRWLDDIQEYSRNSRPMTSVSWVSLLYMPITPDISWYHISILPSLVPCQHHWWFWRCFKMCQSASVDDPSWSDHSLTSAMAPCERRVIHPAGHGAVVLLAGNLAIGGTDGRGHHFSRWQMAIFQENTRDELMKPKQIGWWSKKTSGNTYGHTPENSGNPIPCWRTPETLSAILIQHQ